MVNAKLTVLVMADSNRTELRHTINSVLRSIDGLNNIDIKLLDLGGLYRAPYKVQTLKVEIIHKVSKLKGLDANMLVIVPKRTLMCRSWLERIIKIQAIDKEVRLYRPEYNVIWGETFHPEVIRQTAGPTAIGSLNYPLTSGIVAVNRSLFMTILDEKAELNIDERLDLGLPWMNLNAVVIPRTVSFLYKDTSYSLPTNYLSYSAFSLNNLPMYTSKLVDKQEEVLIPGWLLSEWKFLNRIDNRLFPTKLAQEQAILKDNSFSLSLLNTLGSIAASLHHDHYDYIIFVPWLIKGGADKFAINYANAIKKMRPKLNVLIIATLNNDSTWSSELNDVDFCNFGRFTNSLTRAEQLRLIRLIISQYHPKTLHILNSQLGYEFIASSGTELIKSRRISVAATSFSQETSSEGRILGYSHTHMPAVYSTVDIITTDNQVVADMWVSEYGFERKKILVHHQPISVPLVESRKLSNPPLLRVLWAARVAAEKQPELVAQIGRLLLKKPEITIDMYGQVDEHFDTSFLKTLPSNVRYKGTFDGFSNLPTDKYDAYLYTTLFDGMPNAILEAAQHQLPIVSSAIGGIPEFIQSDEIGILIEDYKNPAPYAAALESLAREKNLRKTMIQGATRQLKKAFSPEAYIKNVDSMLKRLGL